LPPAIEARRSESTPEKEKETEGRPSSGAPRSTTWTWSSSKNSRPRRNGRRQLVAGGAIVPYRALKKMVEKLFDKLYCSLIS